MKRRFVNDVDFSTIPVLPDEFDVLDASDLAILGYAPKVVLRHRASRAFEHAYIAKAPRKEGPRECVTEYLISWIGRSLPISMARCRLARLRHRCGPVPGSDDPDSRNYCPEDLRFLSRIFRNETESLVHGVEVVAQSLNIQATDIQAEISSRADERKFYTVSFIDEVFAEITQNGVDHQRLRDAFGRMMAFDALIGTNDRHPQNWGLLVSATSSLQRPRFSPLFDTSRGLFWNTPDRRLEEWEKNGEQQMRIKKYAESSTPLIGVDGFDQPNHYDVIDYMVNYSSDAFGPAVRHLLSQVSARKIERVVREGAARFFSPIRLRFITDLLHLRHRELSKILC